MWHGVGSHGFLSSAHVGPAAEEQDGHIGVLTASRHDLARHNPALGWAEDGMSPNGHASPSVPPQVGLTWPKDSLQWTPQKDR